MTALTGLLIVVGVLTLYVALCFVEDAWGLRFVRRLRQRSVR
jgi:hypothetical protein